MVREMRRFIERNGSSALADLPDRVVAFLVRDAVLRVLRALAALGAAWLLLDFVTWYFSGMHRPFPWINWGVVVALPVCLSIIGIFYWKPAIAYHMTYELAYRRKQGKWRWER